MILTKILENHVYMKYDQFGFWEYCLYWGKTVLKTGDFETLAIQRTKRARLFTKAFLEFYGNVKNAEHWRCVIW